MTPETFCEQFATFAEAPNGVAKLRELILQLAVQGKLGTQDVNDEPAAKLLNQIQRRSTEGGERETASRKSVRPGVNPNGNSHALPRGWAQTRLDDVAEIVMGNSPPGSSYNEHGEGVPLINGPVEFSQGPFGFTVRTKFTTEPTKFCKKDDLLICVRGSTTGRTNIAAFDACIGRGVAAVQAGKVQPYINLFILALRQAIFDMGTGSTFPSISYSQIASLPFPLPPLAEQRRIVGKVDQLLGLCDELAVRQAARREARERLVGATLDRLVSARSAAEFPAHAHRLRDHFDRLFDTPTTLPQLRQAILQLAVQGQLVPQDPNDEPADVLLERAQKECVDATDDGEASDEAVDSSNDSDDLRFDRPASWKLVRFADLISYGPRNGISPKPVQHVTKTKSLTLSATTSGTFDGRHVKYLTEEFPADSILWLKDGDILIQRSNSEHYVGVAAIYRGERNDFVYPDLMMKVRVASCIDVAFAHLILMSPPSRAYFRTRATGTSGSMRKINKTTVKSLPFPLPPLSEQKRIVSKVTELLSLCDALEAKLTQAESASTQLLAAAVHHLLTADCSARVS